MEFDDNRRSHPTQNKRSLPPDLVAPSSKRMNRGDRVAKDSEDIPEKEASTEDQMQYWIALKRTISGIINKVNVSNIGKIVKELFNANIVRGSGFLAHRIILAQQFSPVFSQVYACLVAIVNTKLPTNGELILHRLVNQFKKSYKRKNKNDCVATVKFIAHLVNQGVAHELLALQVLTLLLETPTDDSVELCIAFLKECGMKLKDVSSRAFTAVNDTLRNVLHEGKLQKRNLYIVETYLKILKDGFKEHPPIIPSLDLVSEEDQITHLVSLEDNLELHTELNIFKMDPEFLQNNEKYEQLKAAILGDGNEGETEGSGDDESSDEDKGEILDNTSTNMDQFKRTMYLTLMSSINYEETVHKIICMKLPSGSERQVLDMIQECACRERSYMKYFGLTSQRLCILKKPYMDAAEVSFRESFATIHRLESKMLRNAARYFAQLLYSDAIPWSSLECIQLNEEDTNASSRIFIKILFQELAKYMGLVKLNERLNDPSLAPFFEGIFSKGNPKHSRFSVNFFTTIGLGGLTESLREYLKTTAALRVDDDDSSSDDNNSGDESSEENVNDSLLVKHKEYKFQEFTCVQNLILNYRQMYFNFKFSKILIRR
ncbi:Pre-mRNA-splicing factor CWC22-like protein isoform X1 [Oopsacas minuta]|uniref:Pre-mRNA-splicing factor CWC22-like protein isoform X1 n=1 Tax=Oopsacas minuta TaxID=111878 RepID=A0AAV7KJB0_9METZ|nr:Pre-mRNA-splicing factor CWC22-like protein isoform X1 [Oopsacas minuta]